MKSTKLLNVLTKTTAYSEQGSELHHGLIERVWAEVIKPATRLPIGSRILDVGAGDGHALELFLKDGMHAAGVNFVQADLDACLNKGIPCYLADMHDLDLRRYDFDLVFCRHCLEHSPFPMLALAEFHRVLGPRGWLYVEVPAPSTGNFHELNSNHWSMFTAPVWSELLKRAGFTIVEHRELRFKTLAGDDCYYLWLCRKEA